jgi:transcriptional regulator with XRE-family HTH domain
MSKERDLFVKRLRMACVVKGVSRKRLSEKAGIPLTTLNNIFTGKSVSYKRMDKLRESTGLSEVEFINLAGE